DRRMLEPDQLQQRTSRLRQLCWQVAGVERRGPDLRQALRRLHPERQELESLPVWHQLQGLPPGERLQIGPGLRPQVLALHELRQRLVLAELLVSAASFRQESRGGHFRTDAPSPQPFWACETLQQREHPVRSRPLRKGAAG
ncbi:MAG: L-aspartate oxidase, partial [Synechococcaceae cyanobacterium]|nr:L-aspartate oxidase [Synechococcaceae cyanobacterium]